MNNDTGAIYAAISGAKPTARKDRLRERLRLLTTLDGPWGFEHRDALCEILAEIINEMEPS